MFTILCFEGEDSLRADLAEELTESGYTVMQAKDGEEALACIHKRRPDLILSDISMPKVDGFGLLKHVRDDTLVKEHIPFIFLSARSGREHVITGLDQGSDDYLVKPVDYGLLLAKVKAALRQARRVQKGVLRDQVKIYKALSGADIKRDEGSRTTAVPETCRKTVVLIGKRSERTSISHRILQALGHQVLVYRSGKVFLEKAPTLTADSIILDFYTDDCQAPMLSKFIWTHPHLRVPMMLLWPKEHGQPPEDGSFRNFETILPMPPSPNTEWVKETFRTWLDGQGRNPSNSQTALLSGAQT